MMMALPEIADVAEKNVRDILTLSLQHSSVHSAVVVYDARCELAKILTEAYRRCLPGADFIDFDQTSADAVLAVFEALKPSDLVVLIQSTNFRLNAFRVRVELFNRSLKVIEHPHLLRMEPEQIVCYIDSLAYDPQYFRRVGPELKVRIDRAQIAHIESGGETLTFASGFESAKLNVGDFRGMKNVGSQFPIGEVFTEARDLEAVEGRVRIFAFGDTSFTVNQPEKPITLVVRRGKVTEVSDSTPEFDRVLENIRADEGDVWVRELGLGLNRAFTRERQVCDIGTYERMCGVHLSLGAKHAVYKKPNFVLSRNAARHHVDVFAVTESVTIDGEIVYRDGAWQV